LSVTGPRIRRSRGIGLLSALGVMVLFGLLVYVGGRLVPVYLEYRGVRAALEAAAGYPPTDLASLRSQIGRGFETAGVRTVSAADVDIITDSAPVRLDVSYDAVAPFLGNVGFVVHFSVSVPLRHGDAP
jgi:Domain of unknown function (DUF4845)